MATAGIVPGTLAACYVGATKITHLTTNSFRQSRPTRSTASKDSGVWDTKAPNRGTWTMSASAMWASDAANGFTALKTAMDAGTAVTVMFSTEVSGDKKFSGSAYITDIGIDAADDDNAVFDVSFEGTGALTEGTVGS